MKAMRAFKTELGPNNKQRSLFVQYAGAARFCYNWALADRIDCHKAGRKTNLYEQKKRFNALKKETFPWLGGIAYVVMESAFANMDVAYQNFFRRVKQGKGAPGFPKFKSRKNGIGGFTMRGSIRIEDGRIKLPRLGWVRLKESGYLPVAGAKVLSVNVSEQAGRWYASAQTEVDMQEPVYSDRPAIGIDLGCSALAVCSDGMVFANPRALVTAEKKLAHAQREVSRRKKGSKNREKSKRRVAVIHARIANIRRHALHNVSYYVTAKAKPSTIVLEDLNVAGMVKNHHLARAVADASFAELRRQIEYKAKWYGVNVLIADRWFPSSKTCSACGTVKEKLGLGERTFVCATCGTIINRDLNAAINLACLAAKPAVSACGGDLNLVLDRPSSVKQELSSLLVMA